jgi:hypothetical protein
MQSLSMNRTVLRLFAWCGPLLMLILFSGLVVLTGFIPPPSPAASAAKITHMYVHNLTSIRVGLFVSLFGMCLIAPWGVSIATFTRPIEGRTPAWCYLQLVSVAIGTTIAILCGMVWALASFRPSADPNVTRMLNDFGWYLFLFSAPAFSIWDIAIAGSILSDRSRYPRIPRWVAYLNLWCALGEVPAAFLLFFKRGPLSFDGLLCFWIPTVVFFAWMSVMSYYVLRGLTRPQEEPSLVVPDVTEGVVPVAAAAT